MPTPPSIPTPARPRRLRRWAWRLGIGVVALYMIGALALYLFQSWLVFPGSFTQGSARAMLTLAAGEETVALNSASGERTVALYGTATRFDGTPMDPGGCPTVIYFYGNNECIQQTRWMSAYLRQQGLNVLIPEYPGYGVSAGRASEKSFYAAADAAYAYLTQQRGVPARSIIIAGRSIGSGPAVYLASRQPAGGLMTFSAFTSLSDVAGRLVKVYPAGWMLRTHFDNEERIKQVRCPILIVHGNEDALVPFAMAGRLERAAGGPVERVTVQGGDHNDLFAVGGWELRGQIGQFARKAGR